MQYEVSRLPTLHAPFSVLHCHLCHSNSQLICQKFQFDWDKSGRPCVLLTLTFGVCNVRGLRSYAFCRSQNQRLHKRIRQLERKGVGGGGTEGPAYADDGSLNRRISTLERDVMKLEDLVVEETRGRKADYRTLEGQEREKVTWTQIGEVTTESLNRLKW